MLLGSVVYCRDCIIVGVIRLIRVEHCCILLGVCMLYCMRLGSVDFGLGLGVSLINETVPGVLLRALRWCILFWSFSSLFFVGLFDEVIAGEVVTLFCWFGLATL